TPSRASGSAIGLYSGVDALRYFLHSQRSEKILKHLLQLTSHQSGVAFESLSRQPQGPVPEVSVEFCERVGIDGPRHVRRRGQIEVKTELHEAREDRHVVAMLPEWVQECCQGTKGADDFG